MDNAAILGVNAAPVTDFAKEMAQEEGVDCDLELELENLMFLEEQNSKQKNKEKKFKHKDNRKLPKGIKPKVQRNKPNVMPNNTNITKPVKDTVSA